MKSFQVLIVDDEQPVREIIKLALAKLKCKVIMAENGKIALEMFKTHKPDVIILDLRMPVMNGFEFLKALEPKTTDPYMVIVLTGHGTSEDVEKSYSLGVNVFIRKPLNVIEIREAVKRCIVLNKFHEQLEEKVEQRTIELKEANKQLEDEIKEKTILQQSLIDANSHVESLYERLRREYDIAAKIFSNIVRTNIPKCSNVNFLSSSMEIACGDIALAIQKPSGGMYVFVGDFTGHGLSAAIGAIPVTDIFYSSTEKDLSICDIVSQINNKLKSTFPTSIFLAACIMELNYSTNTLTLWNGGLPDALVVGKNGGIKKRLKSNHLPLGILSNDNINLDVEIAELDSDDRVYIYSDGVIESFNPDGEMFGQKRFDDFFNNNYCSENAIEKIGKKLNEFRGNSPQKDDITLVEVICAPGEFDYKNNSQDNYDSQKNGWEIAFKFDAPFLKQMNLSNFIQNIILEKELKIDGPKEDIFLVLTELITNAMQYGLLNLSSELKKDITGFEKFMIQKQEALNNLTRGWIKLNIEFSFQDNQNRLIIIIEDSGSGFNYQAKLLELSENLTLSGRGIQLLHSICKEVTFYGNGNKVKVIYEW